MNLNASRIHFPFAGHFYTVTSKLAYSYTYKIKTFEHTDRHVPEREKNHEKIKSIKSYLLLSSSAFISLNSLLPHTSQYKVRTHTTVCTHTHTPTQSLLRKSFVLLIGLLIKIHSIQIFFPLNKRGLIFSLSIVYYFDALCWHLLKLMTALYDLFLLSSRWMDAQSRKKNNHENIEMFLPLSWRIASGSYSVVSARII